ncbi:MAG: hypothetical protein MJZ71_05550 [Bacteroidales bacterium]|nr:hypothetical protein [Bacteroidales bacterium]
MNYQAEIYKSVAKCLKEYIPEIKWIDIEKDQLQREREEFPMPMPAVLIGVGDVDWKTATGKQYGDIEVEIQVYLGRGEETYIRAEGVEGALDKLGWQDRVYEALERRSGETFTGMTRVATKKAELGKRYVKMVSRYRCTVHQPRPKRYNK